MNDSSLNTTQMNQWLDRMRAGDRAALDQMLAHVCGRLELLARKMLGRFRRVRRWVDTGDVLQGALVRLARALEQIRPSSTRELLGLAAEQIRRELLDLARHYYRPSGPGVHHAERDGDGSEAWEPADERALHDDLDRWSAFHEEVNRLPAEEREVIGLTFYHGWTQAQIAELFGVDERTIRRRWRAACLRLGQALGGQLPEV